MSKMSMRYKKVLELPILLHMHAADLDLAHSRYHLQPAAIDNALGSLPATVHAGGRRPKSLSVTADLDRRITTLAERHSTSQWKIVSALLTLAAWDPLCPSHAGRAAALPHIPVRS